jgi:polysaccharide biosynthesis transport protein
MSTLNPIHQDLKQKLFEAESELAALEAKQKASVNALIGTKEGELRNIPEEQKKLGDLEKGAQTRTRRSIRATPARARGRPTCRSRWRWRTRSTTFRVVDPAVLPIKACQPGQGQTDPSGHSGGSGREVLGVVLARESLDSSVKDIHDPEKSRRRSPRGHSQDIQTKFEDQRTKKRERFVYTVSGLYFLLICTSLLHEVMGLTYIESILSHLGFNV